MTDANELLPTHKIPEWVSDRYGGAWEMFIDPIAIYEDAMKLDRILSRLEQPSEGLVARGIAILTHPYKGSGNISNREVSLAFIKEIARALREGDA